MNSVDQRIVSMKFDNAQFEQKAQMSLNTLDKLKNSLNFEKSSKSLESLSNQMRGFSVASVSNGIESLELKFSAFGVAAATVISNITTSLTNKLAGAFKNTIGLIESGGLRRAMNLEQARFSMRGLLETTDEYGNTINKLGISVADVMGPNGPVQKSVDGTAYGLDEAAKAASNFIASGITDLPKLEKVLSSISGSAAQTGSSFEEVAHIYQRIAGNGRVYATDLQSFAARGVNAAAALASYLNTTEQDIRENFVSKGLIDIETFSDAMYAAFGENAFRANETYTGSLSNLKAALSRLGAKFETKKLENMRDIFNESRLAVNELSKALDPLINYLVGLNTNVKDIAVDKIKDLTKYFKGLNKTTILPEDFEQEFERLSQGMNKAQKMDLRKKLEGQVSGPINNIKVTIESLVGSLKNLGSGFGNIIGPIIDQIKTFAGYVSPVTYQIRWFAESIQRLTKQFKDFTLTESFDTNVFGYFKSAVQAVLNVLDLGYTAIKSIAKSLKDLLAPALQTVWFLFDYLTRPMLDFISSIGEIVRENSLIELSVKKISDILKGVLGPVLDWIWKTFLTDNDSPVALLKLYDILEPLSDGFAKLASKVSDFLQKDQDFSSIGNTIVFVFNKVLEWLTPVGKGFENLGTSVKDFFSKIYKNEDGITLFERIGSTLEKLGGVVSKVAGKIVDGFFKIGDAITNNLSPERITGFASLGAIAANGGFLAIMFSLVKDFTSKFDGIKGTIDTVIGSVQNLINMFKGDIPEIDTNGVQSLAVAIGVLAGSVFLLSMVDPNALTLSTVALAAVITELVGAIKLIDNIAGDKQQADKIRKMSTALTILSGALLLSAIAFKMLSDIEWDALERGLLATGSLMAFMLGYSAAMSEIGKNKGKMIKAGGTLIALAIAIDLLVIAVKKLGEMDYDNLSQGLVGVGILLASLGIYQGFSSLGKFSASSGIGILALAGGILVLSSAVEKIGSMDPQVVASGLLAIAGALLIFAGYAKLIEKSNPVSSAASLLIVGASMMVIANALKKLADINPQRLAEGLIMMSLAMAVVISAINLLPEKGALSSATSIAIAASGLLILSVALRVLSSIPLTSVITGLAAMAGSLLIFGLAARALEGSELTLIAIGAGIALFGAGLLALSVGIGILTPVLVAFSTALVASLEIILSGIITMGTQIMEAISTVLGAVVMAFDENKVLILGTLVGFLLQLLDTIIEYIPQFNERINALLDGIIAFVTENLPKLITLGFTILLGILQGISDNIQQVVAKALEIITNFINGIAIGIPGVIDAGFNLLLSFINGMANAVREHSYEMGEAAWNLVSALIEGIINFISGFFNDPIEKIKELGQGMLDGLGEFLNFDKAVELAKNLIDGIVDGITAFFDDPIGTITDLGSSLLGSFCDILGINSPSKEFEDAGGDIVSGLDSGLSDYKSATSTIGGMAKTLLADLTKKLSGTQSQPAGQNMVNGLISGFNSKSGELTGAASKLSSNTIQTMNEGLSPTKFVPIGANSISGLSKGITSKTVDAKTASTNISNTIKGTFNTNLSASTFTPIGKNVVSGLGTGITNNSGSATKASKNAAAAIKNGVTGTLNYDAFYGIGVNTMAGMEKGIINKANSVKNTVVNTANNIIRSMRNTMQIASPSKVFYGIGQYCMLGLRNAFGKSNIVTNKVEELGKKITEKLNSNIDSINDNGFTITPVLDLSEIQNGASRIGNILDTDQRVIGSIASSVNVKSNDVSMSSAINKLVDSINQRIDSEVSTADIFDAVKDGLSNATVVLRIGGREITSIVNDINLDDIESKVSFLGGM